ncbi:MAG TPA: EamA family transporter [Burkholderiaceae bacterium]|nr:EamA family transporter [Burkholderiaceae bacterium]
MIALSRRDAVLLVLLTLAWGFTWPVMKYGVRELPPLYFRMLCIGGALPILAVVARLTAVPLTLPRTDWLDIARLALPNVVVWHVAVILALTLLPAGRSAILGYTMPLWAALIGALWFGEHPPARHWVGVAAALAATALLLSSELTSLAGRPTGTLLMLFAAASWGYGTHQARRRAIHVPALTAIFWMLGLALIVLVTASLAFERDRWRIPRNHEWIAIGFNMSISIAFCHVVWLRLARNLPPAASGLSMMMIPALGVFTSIWLLGERPRWQDYVALGLIVFSLATVLLPATSLPSASTLTPDPSPAPRERGAKRFLLPLRGRRKG